MKCISTKALLKVVVVVGLLSFAYLVYWMALPTKEGVLEGGFRMMVWLACIFSGSALHTAARSEKAIEDIRDRLSQLSDQIGIQK